jgi:polyisoprenoid-binding protein YceI
MARSRRKLGLVAAGILALLVVAGAAGWWFVLRDDAPEEANIGDASQTLDEAGGAGDGEAASGDAVEGEWAVDTSIGSFDDFTGTYAGYRVDEELANIGATTAVGRTPDVSGTMTVAGDEVTGVDVEVDVTTLQSDNDLRDGQLGGRGLETDRFPTATFALTQPIALPDGVESGERVTASATGDLTVHGVTNEVTLDVDAELSDGAAVIVGQAPITLTDFGIEPPTGARVLSIRDDATFEFQLFFTRG